MKILVVGGNGQLGRHLRQELPGADFWDRTIVDITDTATLGNKLAAVRPDAIINAAAYTAVDKAEYEADLAWRVNAEAPAVLARAAQRLDIPLIHVSTDYVFDGSKVEGYVEDDPVRPLNVYGCSKLGGELAVAILSPRCWILRTSWVFSEYGSNFPKSIMRLAAERDELRVVDDQRGRPTYAGDLARCIAELLKSAGSEGALPFGLHHVGGGPVLSWKAFAVAVLDRAKAANVIARIPRIVGITTEQYPTPAARPRNSLLLTRPATALHTQVPFDWERGLARVITAIA